MTQSTLRFLIGGLLTVGALASLARGDDKTKPELLPPPHCPTCSQKAACCTPGAAGCESKGCCDVKSQVVFIPTTTFPSTDFSLAWCTTNRETAAQPIMRVGPEIVITDVSLARASVWCEPVAVRTAPSLGQALYCGDSCQMSVPSNLIQASTVPTLVSSTCDTGSTCQYSKLECEILRKLEAETVNCEFKNTSIQSVIDQLTEEAKLNYVIDVRAIKSNKIVDDALSHDVTMRLKGARLKCALTFALHQNHLTYKVENDALVIIPETECTPPSKPAAAVTNTPSTSPVPNVYPSGVSEIPPRPESSPASIRDWQTPSVILIQPANLELAGMATWALGTLADWICESAADKNPPPPPAIVPPTGYVPVLASAPSCQPAHPQVPSSTFATSTDRVDSKPYGCPTPSGTCSTPLPGPSPTFRMVGTPVNTVPACENAPKECQRLGEMQHPVPGQLQSLQFRKPTQQPVDVTVRDFRAAGMPVTYLAPAPCSLPVAPSPTVSAAPTPVCVNCPTPLATPTRIPSPALGSVPVAFGPTPGPCESSPTLVSTGNRLSVPALGQVPVALDVAVPSATPQVCEVPQALESQVSASTTSTTTTRRSSHWVINTSGDSERPTFIVQSPRAQMVCEQLRLKANDGASLEFVAGKKTVHLRGKHFEAEAESIEFAEKEGKLLLVGSASLTYREPGKTECAVRGQKLIFDPSEANIKISGTDR